MSYDTWKTTNPADAELGGDESEPIPENFGECDCCGRLTIRHQCWAFGNVETWACAECSAEPSDFWDKPAGSAS